MQIQWKRCILAWAIALSVIVMPISQMSALALEPEIQAPDAWAVSELVDAEALNLLPGDYAATMKSVLSSRQEEHILNTVRMALSQLGLEAGGGERVVQVSGDPTRGNFVALLYNELAALQAPEALFYGADTPMEYMVRNGIVKGYGNGDLGENNPCTLQEALLIATRFITDLYESMGEASRGLLWKAVNGGNTLYLLGTIHVDRGNIYPFSKNLMDAILSSGTAIFEVDLLDREGYLYYANKQLYSDGTTLKDHISEDLYNKIVASMAELGYSEEQTASIKAWALANLFSSLALHTEDTPMVMDSYVYSKALVEGIEIGELEGYAFQADLFDSLSKEYQESYLLVNYYSYILSLSEEAAGSTQTIDEWLGFWKTRDAQSFETAYSAAIQGAETDELYILLFKTRNPDMTAKAAEFLVTEGENTYILVVGAGHMVGTTGIVNGLREMGFSVELVPAE